jgi:uncharacterized protein (DUF952 family)
MNELIYHFTTEAEWQQAQARGVYEAPSLASEGFIHFSMLDQVDRVANAFYFGRQDMLLLLVDTRRLNAELRYEMPIHPPDAPPGRLTIMPGEKFPHLYGPLNLDAVMTVKPYHANADGSFGKSKP